MAAAALVSGLPLTPRAGRSSQRLHLAVLTHLEFVCCLCLAVEAHRQPQNVDSSLRPVAVPGLLSSAQSMVAAPGLAAGSLLAAPCRLVAAPWLAAP